MFRDIDLTSEIPSEEVLHSSMKPRSDLFAKVKVSVDTSSHVAPIAVVQKKSPEESKESHIDTYLNSLGHKITTLGTYSYCESSN